jgi:hypothetical protein
VEWNSKEKRFQIRPVLGMICLIPGIPIIECPIHCPDYLITTVALHTLDSVMQYKEDLHVCDLAEELRHYTFECKEESLHPIYEFLIIRNDCSVKARDLLKGSYDG